jgi:hypothetical protein
MSETPGGLDIISTKSAIEYNKFTNNEAKIFDNTVKHLKTPKKLFFESLCKTVIVFGILFTVISLQIPFV